MTTLVFLLEEPSAREMLDGVMQRLMPQMTDIRFVVFEGKQDMMHGLERKLRGWLAPDTRFVVFRDQDSADCHDVKQALVEICRRAGRPDALTRVACRELESFYLGDLAAVEHGLELNGLATRQDGRKYRSPDGLNNAKEELIRLTGGHYQERAGSRSIARHLRIDGANRSRSFNVLLAGIQRLTRGATGADGQVIGE